MSVTTAFRPAAGGNDEHLNAVGEALQILGAVAILIAYTLGQFRVLDVRSWAYLGLNFAGALVLAVIAFVEGLWGFFLLEAAWTAVSASGIAMRLAEPRRERG